MKKQSLDSIEDIKKLVDKSKLVDLIGGFINYLSYLQKFMPFLKKGVCNSNKISLEKVDSNSNNNLENINLLYVMQYKIRKNITKLNKKELITIIDYMLSMLNCYLNIGGI